MEGKGRSQEPECEQGAINDPRAVILSRDVREMVCVQVCVGASIVETALGRGTPRVIEVGTE